MSSTNQDNKTMSVLNTDDTLLMTILDDSNQMVQVSELDTMTMLYANRTARAYTGHENQSYGGEYCYKYMMGLDSQCPFCPLKKLHGNDTEETEIDNGKQVFAVKTTVQEWQGRTVFIEYARDITEIRRSEKIFKSQMERLLKSIPHAQGIMHMDLTDDICLTIGGASQNMKTFDPDMTVDKTMEQMASFVPQDDERAELLKEFSRDAFIKAYEDGKTEINHVTRSYFDDGSIRYARIFAKFLMNPSTNHLECVVYGMDVSDEIKERQKNEKHLAEQLSIFNVLSKNYLNVYLVNAKEKTGKILKLDGYVTTGLNKTKNMTYSYTDMYKQYVKERVHPSDKEFMLKAMSLETILEKLQTVDSYTGTYQALVDDEPHTYQFRFDKLNNSDEIIAAFQNIDDMVSIEKERQKELAIALDAAEQSNRAKTQFLNNMSHDIRTPMNAIIGFTSLASEHYSDSEKVKDYLGKINTSGKHLLSLINDVLDMSRIESGKVELEEEEIDLLDIVAEIESILLPDVNEKNITFKIDTKHITNKNVICDKLRLKQILLNLLSNAVKFTNPGGSVDLRITQNTSAPIGYASYVIQVNDTGIGMTEEFQKHVFEAFSRERTSTVSGIQGTGLGLAITKNFVDVMGGTIQVKSKVGVGTEFTVNLQFQICGSDSKKIDSITKEKVDFTGKKILLVEDIDLNREIAKEILAEAGFAVELAEDGDVAVEKVRNMHEGEYDVILMDIQMPRMDGYTAARTIRSLPNKVATNIPIIAVTANAFNEDKDAAISAGMNGHVSKPLDIDELMTVLANVLHN